MGAQYMGEYQGKGRLVKTIVTYGGLFRKDNLGFNRIDLTEEQVPQLKRLFLQLMQAYESHFIEVPLTFYREACVSKAVPWKRAVYLTVALECFFLDQERNKSEELAKRVADFLAEDSDSEDTTYQQIFALYKARNAVVHDGIERPVVVLTDSSGELVKFDCASLTEKGSIILRRCAMKMLESELLNKQMLLHRVRCLSERFERAKLQWTMPTVN